MSDITIATVVARLDLILAEQERLEAKVNEILDALGRLNALALNLQARAL